MTADTITVEQLDSIRVLLECATDSIDLLIGNVKHGNVTPEEAAAIVNDMMRNLNAATR